MSHFHIAKCKDVRQFAQELWVSTLQLRLLIFASWISGDMLMYSLTSGIFHETLISYLYLKAIKKSVMDHKENN